MSKETMAPFGAELSGDLEQQVSIITTETPNWENVLLFSQSYLFLLWDYTKCIVIMA